MCRGRSPRAPPSCSPPARPPWRPLPSSSCSCGPFPAAQPGGSMSSPLLGAHTDSCVRQNPDCRACSIKLPITLLRGPAKWLPWRQDGPRSGHPGWRDAGGVPGPGSNAPRCVGGQRGEKGRRQRPPHNMEQGGRGGGGERNPLPAPPHAHTGLGSTLPSSTVYRISPPLSSSPGDMCPRFFTFSAHK